MRIEYKIKQRKLALGEIRAINGQSVLGTEFGPVFVKSGLLCKNVGVATPIQADQLVGGAYGVTESGNVVKRSNDRIYFLETLEVWSMATLVRPLSEVHIYDK